MGTISAAAEALGVHRATVNRHVDALEAELGAKLFQRHAKGFTPTELGQNLMRIASTTAEQFEQLNRAAKGQTDELSGDFVVTALDSLAGQILPALSLMRANHPGLNIRFLGTDNLLRLEYGEAHVAFRAGPKPQDPDNVVKHFFHGQMVLVAHKSYIEKYGKPATVEDFKGHHFVGADSPSPKPVFLAWLNKHAPRDRFSFRSNNIGVLAKAVCSGFGIGFVDQTIAGEQADLTEILPRQDDWATDVWMVTHVDLHRSAKVQAFLKALKQTKREMTF